jgi:site-specific recombinase XerD
MRPARKLSTCYSITDHLRDFHAWLAAQDIALGQIDRPAIERWLKSMVDRGLAPQTRHLRIYRVRWYLRWLAERGAAALDSDELIRPSDLPKLPSYLPRPFPTNADREMQRRLLADDTLYGKALFLMRRTGLRIGELARLEPQCLLAEPGTNALLKVPLGKLDNERLIPIDQETRKVLESLTRACPRGAPFLLEPGSSRKGLVERLRATLKQAATGLDITGPVVSHRLRHTYATELLNAGLSLVSIMKLLGHRSFRMTMRYAAITQDTMAKDYHAAIQRISAQYDVPLSSAITAEPDPLRMLTDTISWLRKNVLPDSRARPLIKRLYKLRHDIVPLVEQRRNR